MHYKRASKRTALGQRHKTCLSVVAHGSQARLCPRGYVRSGMLVAARFPFRKSAESANGNGCEILVLSDLSMVWQLRDGMFRGFSLGDFGGVKPLIQLALSALYLDAHRQQGTEQSPRMVCDWLYACFFRETETLRVRMQLCCCRRG